MSEAHAGAAGPEVGCVLVCEGGVLVVLTDAGPVRATYDAALLDRVARDRSRAPEAGEWVSLRRWCDGPLTVRAVLGRPAQPPTAEVLPLRRPARRPR